MIRFTPNQLRRLAERLNNRPGAPSLDGYDLVDGLRAAADLIEGKLGPRVHDNIAKGSDEFPPYVDLATLLPKTSVLSKGRKKR